MRTILHRRGRSAAILFTAAVALISAGCGAASSADSASADAGVYGADTDAGNGVPQCLSSSECPTGWTCSEFDTCVPPTPGVDGGDAAPPEKEIQFSAPESSLRFLYVAMPELGELAKIDGATLDVSSVDVGDKPEVLATAPGSDTAVALDSDNGVAAVVRPTADSNEKTLLATLPHLNRLDIDPTGNYAVAWFDLDKAIADAGGVDKVGEIGSFQDVTVIALNPAGKEHAVDLTVGFKPSKVEFDDAGTHAYVVTQDGISVIDLAQATGAGPTIAPPIPFTDDPLADPTSFEVDVAPSGKYAVVRQGGKANIGVVSLSGADAGTIRTIPLPSEPTDVDLSPDGSRAYAVLRDASELAVIDLPGDAIDPSGVDFVDFSGEVIGQMVLSPDGSRGLLFTNAELKKRISVVELDTAGYPHVTYRLEKAVRAAAFDPSGHKALIIHAKAPGDPATATSVDQFIDRSYGYSVFDVDTGFAKLQITPVDPKAFAFAPKNPSAYLILDGGDAPGAVAEVQEIDLDTGVVRPVDLASPPDAVGVLPGAGSVFVSQRHPLGRVSFIDIATGAMRTVTGFDLNGSVID